MASSSREGPKRALLPLSILDDLLQHHLFAGLSDAQLRRIEQLAVLIRANEGDTLFEQGDPASRFFLVRSGQIKLFRLSPAGNEKVVEIVTAGSSFAEALMFLEQPHYPVGAQALQRSEVVSINAADFALMLRESVDTCFAMLGTMSQRLRGLLHEIDEISLHSASCRVAAYLLHHAPADSDVLELAVAKQVLASRLSVTPETFSRVIKNLGDRGLIRIEGSRVTLRDRDALKNFADA